MALLTSILSTVATAATTALIGVLVNYLRQKTKIIITEEAERKLTKSAENAVKYVEEHVKGVEKASKELQHKGPHKLAMAVEEIMKDNKNVLEEEAVRLVNSTLFDIKELGASSQKPLT